MRHVVKKTLSSVIQESVDGLVREKALLDGVSNLGLAVSGGADSIALLHIMADFCRRRYVVPFVLHFDHGLRGEASKADAEFVREEARKLSLQFYSETGSGIAAGSGFSLEMAARKARQDFFRRAISSLSLDAIATGHHADDVAETLILRLLRGAGTDGLSGLKPLSVIAPSDSGEPGIRFIRPLLRLRRDEIRRWLDAMHLSWRDDASNNDETIQRNFVRHSILPLLSKGSGRNDRPVTALSRSAEILREDDDCLDAVARQWLEREYCPAEPECACGTLRPAAGGQVDFPLGKLVSSAHLAIRRRVLRMWLIENVSPETAGFETVNRILSTTSGVITLPGKLRASISNGILRVAPQDAAAPVPATVEFAPGGSADFGAYTLTAAFSDEIVRDKESFLADAVSCTLSAAAVDGRPLVVRSRAIGDRITPYGVSGSKKVKEIFIDAKVPENLRDTRPIVTCGDEIAWIPGYRIASGFAAKEGEKTILITCRRK